jgi:predicted MFS family arabinose efflux permease
MSMSLKPYRRNFLAIGAGLSNVLAGIVVQKAGYTAGFLMLAAIATVALAVFWFYVPETKSGLRSAATQS